MLCSTGEVETRPDMASFNINLSCLDKSIEISKNCLVDQSNALMRTIKSFGIPEDDILTTSVNLNKSYTWVNNSKVFEGYRSSTSIYVTVKDLKKLDTMYTALLGNENLDLSGLSYSHSKMDELKNDAYVNALQKANLLADRLLQNLPESKKEILKIGNVQISATQPQNNAKALAENDRAAFSASNQPVAISTGMVKVRATLFVEYQIK
ncbi:hypothetical protein GCM10022260_08760 [Gaetbulibacter aestuarii]